MNSFPTQLSQFPSLFGDFTAVPHSSLDSLVKFAASTEAVSDGNFVNESSGAATTSAGIIRKNKFRNSFFYNYKLASYINYNYLINIYCISSAGGLGLIIFDYLREKVLGYVHLVILVTCSLGREPPAEYFCPCFNFPINKDIPYGVKTVLLIPHKVHGMYT